MSEATCCACGLTASIRSLFDLNGQTFCERCVSTASREARDRGQPSIYMPLISRSICARCNTFIGEASSGVQIGGARFCQPCSILIKDWDYPVWLKISLASLLLLLVTALVHGHKYFHAGREMYRGERLVVQGRYAEALPHLQETLTVAPRSDKASLLAAKAAILSGDVASAAKALHDHDNGNYEDGQSAEFLEVSRLWDRANQALEKVDQAVKLAQQEGRSADAAQLMHEAASLYPQLPGVAFAAESLDGGAAFDRGDYDTFLRVSEKQWKENASSESAAQLSSALACKYAVTGNTSFRQRAQEMMERARDLAKDDADARKSLDEYAPRIQYRLDSRRVISKAEYDRIFRGARGPAKPK
jgi:tetratricopeptide (TPR) repeat protein